MPVQPLPPGTATVVLVEGDSDRDAVLVLAGRLGLDLEARAVEVVAMGGATNVGHHVRAYRGARGRKVGAPRLFGLCDAGEARYFTAAFAAAGLPATPDAPTPDGGVLVCHRDLEEELIRALGADAVLDYVVGRGHLASLRRLQRQPAQRDRSLEQHLHRFIGVRAGRKRDYDAGLAAAVPLEAVPLSLTALLAVVTPGS